jgi:hypothetical protein
LSPGRKNSSTSFALDWLPKFSMIDSYDNEIESDQFVDSLLYVQFVNSKKPDQIILLSQVYREFKKKEVNFVVFTDNVLALEANIGIDMDLIHATEKNYRSYLSKFSAPKCCETYYVFDHSKLIRTGYCWESYDDELRGVLNSLTGDRFQITRFIRKGFILNDRVFFEKVCNTIKNNKNYDLFVISLFNDLCDGCRSGQVLRDLIAGSMLFEKKILFIIALSQKYSEVDIANLKSNLRTDIEM